MQPLNDTIYLKPIKKEVSTSGFALADSAIDKPERGMVVHAGKGRMLDNGVIQPTQVKEGDKVIFNKYAPDEVEIDRGDSFTTYRERYICYPIIMNKNITFSNDTRKQLSAGVDKLANAVKATLGPKDAMS